MKHRPCLVSVQRSGAVALAVFACAALGGPLAAARAQGAADPRTQREKAEVRERYKKIFDETVLAANTAVGGQNQNLQAAIDAYLAGAGRLPAGDPLTLDYRKGIGIRLGRTYEFMDKLPEAIGIYDSIPGLKSFSAEAMLRKNQAPGALQRFTELGQLPANDPDFLPLGEAQLGRARALEAMAPPLVPGAAASPELIQAVQAYQDSARNLTNAQGRARALVLLGNLYMKAGQYVDAATAYAEVPYLEGMAEAAMKLGDQAKYTEYLTELVKRSDVLVAQYAAGLRAAETDLPPPQTEREKYIEWVERMKRRLTMLNGISMECDRLAKALFGLRDMPRAAKAAVRATQTLVSFRDVMQRLDPYMLRSMQPDVDDRLTRLAQQRDQFIGEAGGPPAEAGGTPDAPDPLDRLRFTIPELPQGRPAPGGR